MLSGAGSLFVKTTNLTAGNSIRGQNLLFPLCIASFSLDFDTQLAESKCLIDGKRQITAAAITEEIASMKISFEFADFKTLGFAYDEISQTSTTVQIPVIKTATVPTASPYEIVDAEIVTGNLASVLVYKNSPTTSYMVSNATPTTAEHFLASAGKITFAAASAGASVSYTILKTFSTIETIGVESAADSFGNLEFNGIIYAGGSGERYGIQVPKLSRVSTPSIQITGDLATLEVDFRASVPAGQRRPFRLFKLA